VRSTALRAARWCLSSLRDRGGWRASIGLLALVPVLILLAGDRVAVEAEEYSAYSDPKKPAIAVILSEQQNIDEFEEHFGLSEGQVDDILAATRRENRVLAREFGESERVLAANKDLPKNEVAKKIAASDYDEKVSAAVARTKRKIEAVVPGDQSAELEGWVDEQWDQEVQAASTVDSTEDSTEIYTASGYYPRGIRCNVFATQYTGHTRHEVALPHRRLKFGRQPRVSVRRVSGGPKVWARTKEVGPWNTYDNYWARRKHRTMWKRVPRCKPEAQVAYYQNFNGGKDEFGREVLNPAGVDVTRSVARNMGLKRYQNAWVYVRFPWVNR
jgi:hypothetical protein